MSRAKTSKPAPKTVDAELAYDLAVADWKREHGEYAEALLLEPTRKLGAEGPSRERTPKG